MSIDLWIVRTKPLAIEVLLRETGEALREILSLPEAPEIVGEQFSCGEISPIQMELLPIGPRPAIHLRVAREPEIAQIITITDATDGPVTFVSMGSQRTALEFALGAAVAIALASDQGSKIEDPGLFFGQPAEQDPSTFKDTVRVRDSFSGYREAAEQFAQRLET